MNKRTSYIAAAALAIAGTAGMASWIAIEAGGREAAPSIAHETLQSAGVAETEGVVSPAPPVELAEIQPQPGAEAPVEIDAPVMYAPAVPARVDRPTRTPIAAAPRATPAEPANPANYVPVARVEPKSDSVEPVEPAEPAEPRFLEVRVAPGTILGVRLATSVSSDTAELEDRVEATITRDVIADGRVAIPAGTTVLGSVSEVTRGGKFRERARLGIRFHTLVLADGTREGVRVDAIVREGDSPTRESTAKIGGGTVGGAIIGGIMGGRKGAILGGAAGAGAGTAAVLAGDRSVASLASGSPLSVRLDAPVTLTIERNR